MRDALEELERPAGEAKLSAHIFTDASAHATAAVGYIRAQYPDGHVKVSLALARARATPLKKVTIPKLELRGAKLGVEISDVISTALRVPVSEHQFWTDSMNVIHWVRSPAKNFTADVGNRITAIQEVTQPSQWRHVPGKLNPADLPTRGIKAEDLPGCKFWWHGPGFLHSSEDSWPVTQLDNKPQLPGQLKRPLELTFTAKEQSSSCPFLERFSEWNRLVRVAAWCLRFFRNARQATAAQVTRGCTTLPVSSAMIEVDLALKPGSRVCNIPELSVLEVEAARRWWLSVAQQVYADTMKTLAAGKTLPPSDPLFRLSPCLETSEKPALLVVDGRLKYADHLPSGTRTPVILPARHRITELVIRSEDEKCHHDVGPQHLLAELRNRYWIVHGLSAVKAVPPQLCQVSATRC